MCLVLLVLRVAHVFLLSPSVVCYLVLFSIIVFCSLVSSITVSLLFPFFLLQKEAWGEGGERKNERNKERKESETKMTASV